MPFQIKDFRSILAAMVNLVRATTDKLTDFNPGSVTRTLLEAPSAEIEELYRQMYNGIMDAIPVAIYGAFDFSRLPASAAYGFVTFHAVTPPAADIYILAGTQIRSDTGLEFSTLETVALGVGQNDVAVLTVCAQAGTLGNVAAGSLTVLPTAIQGIDGVTNVGAFYTGADEETELERKDRFQRYVVALARGTVAAIEYGAQTASLLTHGVITERVVSARCIEDLENCYVRLIVYNGAGVASDALIARAQEITDGYQAPGGEFIPGYKSAGIVVSVESAFVVHIGIVQTVYIDYGFDAAAVRAEVASVLSTYFAGLKVGNKVVHAALVAAGMSVPGVLNYIVSGPSADYPVSQDQVAVLMSVTSTEIDPIGNVTVSEDQFGHA